MNTVLYRFYFFSLMFILILKNTSLLAVEPVTISIPTNFKAAPGAKGVQIPVYTTDVTERNVIGADLMISYDTSVLTATGATLTGTIAQGSSIEAKPEDQNGQIRIGIMKQQPLSGSGTLVFILFDVDSTNPDDTSFLNFLKADLNEGEVPAQTRNGKIILKEETFILGDVSNDGKVTAYDATLVLRYIVGLIKLSIDQQKAADVTKNNRITAFDAVRIYAYAVGKIDKF
jgi:hypothetical protein